MQEMSYENITEACVDALSGKDFSPLDLLESLMDIPGVPMHDPVHHYIIPAALLTIAASSYGLDAAVLRAKLGVAEERARKLLPGFCGWWGACGAALGCGVFASVWLETSPKKEENWAQINAFTARCLAKVASVNGPRCCKRTSYLVLGEAIPAAKEIFGLELGSATLPICTWSAFNRECRQQGCPFYAAGDKKQRNSAHGHLWQGIEVKK